MEKPFEKESELAEKLERLTELNALLNLDEHGSMDAVGIDEVTVEEESEAVSDEKGLRNARENETGRREERSTIRHSLAAAPAVPYPISMAKRLAEKKEQARSALAASSPPMPQRQALAAEL